MLDVLMREQVPADVLPSEPCRNCSFPLEWHNLEIKECCAVAPPGFQAPFVQFQDPAPTPVYARLPHWWAGE